MAKGLTLRPMVNVIKGTMRRERGRDKECFCGLVARSMKETTRMIFVMVMGFTLIQMA